uniref:DNA mismatch repair protein MutS n=1 Tax=uncultured Bilophila sp. TaxID=529385 RepID=UPI0025D2B3BD|nr:DNA mismatch repair protein MutS [uncultured Bilophila sp.]
MSQQQPASPRVTPMFEQYLRIKEGYPDALLFYRMGDFYELFFEDAEVAARELQIALTSRNPNAESPIPMCGVPWHAAEGYVSQLLNKGYKIAFCDQIEDPRAAKGLVERAVTRVYTPGTAIDDVSLEPKGHTYLGALFWNPDTDRGGFAWVDVSTGYWSGLHVKKTQELWQWAQKIAPRELLLPEDADIPATLGLTDIQPVRVPLRSHFDYKRSAERVLAAQSVAELGALGLEDRKELVQACGALLAYLEQTQMQDTKHLAPFEPLDLGQHLLIDDVTERNLELFRRLDGRKGVGTLRHVLDSTQTPMGGRLLEERLRNPWRELAPIQETQDAIQWLSAHPENRKKLRSALAGVYDLERLSTRIALNRTSPRDMLSLRQSLAALPPVREAVNAPDTDAPHALRRIVEHWDNLDDHAATLEKALADDPPQFITEGGLFKQGYNAELDELLDLVEHGENRVKALLDEEQKASGISKLKLGYNRVFGYYFELSKAVGATPPEHFIRRQTLANSERFTTVRLKELEEKLLSAADKRKSLEYKLFQQLRGVLAAARPRILFMADILAQLDYWQSLTETAVRHNWSRPELHTEQSITIREGRHPVVESIIGEASFVPNDLHMDEDRRLLLITGPNMAGKSTVLRQTALICLLAQMGSFVPAREARLGLCDRIFSRVGASDNLAQGQSTFMVEMMETARILRQATKRSLVILDEIGRGTSTFDGLALAWAVAEELAKRAGGSIRTLFATHYHELTALEGKIPGVHTMNIAIREWNGEIVFLRRLIPGPSDRSYGIEVARLAGVPHPVVQRAREILAQLEQNKGSSPVRQVMPNLLPGISLPETKPKKPVEETPPPSEPDHPLLVALRDTNPDALTPLEALKRITEWKLLWGAPKQ